MMKKLLVAINAAVAQEKALAYKDHGALDGISQAYDVLAEEVREACDEGDYVKMGLSELCECLWKGTSRADAVEEIHRRAILCAAEMVQVAAVCERIKECCEEPVCDACKINLEDEE